MPFQITTQPFGPLPTGASPLTEYILEHTETGEFVSIIPEYGAILRRLALRKGEHVFALIQAPESPQALIADESYASAFLFPFPSRIRHGIYHFEGMDYALKMNEMQRDNALHGFVYNRAFSVVSRDVTPTHAQLIVRYDYVGDTAGYPFPFALTITYELVQANLLAHGSHPENDRMSALRIQYEAQNTGNGNCPAAFGWHPYFTFIEDTEPARESIGNMTLTLPARQHVKLDDHMIPTGELTAEQAGTIDLHELTLDAAFHIESTSQPDAADSFAETTLTSLKTGLRLILGQQTGPGKLNYLVCYTPNRRDRIAIEPLTANVDAFNNGQGLTILNPGESLSGTMWVRLD